MAVEFFVDPYNIERESYDLELKLDLASLREIRVRMNENLASGSIRNLRIRLIHEGLLKRFSDYLGINGVKVTFTPTPRGRVTEKLKAPLPKWITDDVIIETGTLELLDNDQEITLEEIYRAILGFDGDLLSLSTFMTGYHDNFELFSDSLNERTCFNFVYETLKHQIQQEDFRELIDNIHGQAEGRRYIEKLAYASQIEALRQYADNEGLSVALPPMPVSVELLRDTFFYINSLAFPNINGALSKLFEQAMAAAKKTNDSCILERFPIMPVEGFFEGFVGLILSNYSANMEGFVQASLSMIPEDYHADLNKLLLNHSVDNLPIDADIDTTLAWAESYFKVLQEGWVEGASIPDGLETHFSDWYLQNRVRVARSKHDWTRVSASIQQSLKDREVVVVYMVDALSGIHLHDITTMFAEKLPKCHVSSRLCFAPTPTLTEVGKTAVLTGKKPYSLSQNNEKALLAVYSEQGLSEQGLTVHKSWEHRKAVRLNESTELYLYLENRIDECLHDRKQYEEYSAYGRVVDFVVGNIAKHAQEASAAAERWSKKIKFIVTADHGVTKSPNQIKFDADKVKERIVLNADNSDAPEGLYKFDTGYRNLGTCIVPKNRDSFLEVAFSHGGLTPEEVLIPWIEITSNDPKEVPFAQTDMNVSCHTIGEKKWNITLNANLHTDEDLISFRVSPPFSIIGNGNWDSVSGQLLLSMGSTVNHAGLVAVDLNVDFKGKHLITVPLEIDFPKSLVKQDKASSAFDDMLGF
ncbi:hypothetical protein BCU13_007625 [Vibrio lentus]|uniref:hypothetical protein n=1 Tax=Vibrio lentus TaxID=136468 RepID=UPI000C817453|nr:hypothetical protein [Vibrio lentus]PMJ84757.1 hypothetical protein BCU13_16215 [Vibrio lentus]